MDPVGTRVQIELSTSGNIVYVGGLTNSRAFFNHCLSPNREYLLAWNDGSPSHTGDRPHKKGVFLLVKGDVLRVSGQLPRPFFGDVSDDGTFVIVDATFKLNEPGSVLYVISRSGKKLFKHQSPANGVAVGISSPAQWVVYQTANHSEELGQMHFFEIARGKLLWQKQPETGWPNRYTIDSDKRIIYAWKVKRGGDGPPFDLQETAHRYSFDGECLDLDAWERDRREQRKSYLEKDAKAWVLLEEAKQTLKDREDGETAKSAVELLRRGLQRPGSDHTHAQICRVLGEIAERRSQTAVAIEAYQRAISLYPKIGVKRRLASLVGDRR